MLVGSALLLKLAVNRTAFAVAAEHIASSGAAKVIASAASVAGALLEIEAEGATAGTAADVAAAAAAACRGHSKYEIL